MSTREDYRKPQRKIFAASGATNASGNVVIDMTAAQFAAAPIVTLACQSANAALVDARITALTPTSVTINVQQALAVTLLGISILSAKIPANNVSVHIHALEAG